MMFWKELIFPFLQNVSIYGNADKNYKFITALIKHPIPFTAPVNIDPDHVTPITYNLKVDTC
jgi:hypothetical protein